MKRDSIFYKLFRQSPTALFDLLPNSPENASRYRFDSVAVKEPRFEIDGVLLPPEDTVGPVFFIEVQFQPDKTLYERIFAEIALYFYRNAKRFSDWQVIVIYPSRSTEQKRLYPHRSLLNGPQFHRICLDELGDISTLPIWIGLMVLTTIDEAEAPTEARQLIDRTEQINDAEETRAIIEMVTTIISYKFKELTPREVEEMLDITFEETRVYREVKAEAERKGLEEGLEKGLEKGLEEGLEKGLEEGLEKGRKDEALSLVTRLLKKRFGQLDSYVQSTTAELSVEDLEDLSEAIFDFSNERDLKNWLQERSK
ncbi:MAG: Rpn family recombination-promoting nuclease/putative transposase [Cyanobacteria bacterium P01_D01_bin.36]